MCRWLGYRGGPVAPAELLYGLERSLIEQSRRHAPNMPLPNGDGTGLGWHDRAGIPALYRSISPAWADENLRELAGALESPLFLAHVRAGTGSAVQQTNCHPFRYGKWLFVHNGYINQFPLVHRDLMLSVDPDLFGNIRGTTDSELMFHLALTFGLDDDPLGALERMAGFIESVGATAGVADPLQMTVGLTDGTSLYAARYASSSQANTLYVSEDLDSIRMLYPENERFAHLSSGARVVVSEPLFDLPGVWREVPTSTALIVTDDIEVVHFEPRRPA